MGNKILFTQEQLDKILELHDQKLTDTEIGKILNVSKSTIRRTLVNLGISTRHPLLTEERQRKAIELYSKYGNVKAVERELKMSECTIREILLKNNIHINNISEVKKRCVIDETFFDEINSPRKAYYLGLLCADGTVGKNCNVVSIALQDIDGYIIENFKKDLKTNYAISILKYNDKNPNWKNQMSISITNSYFHDSLIKQGVIPNKSKKLKFPNNLPKEYYPAFIRGYMDGDGNISKNPKDCRCKLVGTEDFCNSISDILLDELNVRSSITLCHHNENVPTRQLQIAGRKQVKKFLDWIYDDADIYLKRKYQIYQDVYCV